MIATRSDEEFQTLLWAFALAPTAGKRSKISCQSCQRNCAMYVIEIGMSQVRVGGGGGARHAVTLDILSVCASK